MQHGNINALDFEKQKYWAPDKWSTSVPDLLMRDHFADTGADINSMSLPLLAMQYTLRHFVKCADFCIVCHCKTFENLNSFKPYVCSRELCLSQYMHLGIGSSTESKILLHPNVVDLLVCLAYLSAVGNCLEGFPDGLDIKVPPMPIDEYLYPGEEGRSFDFPYGARLDTEHLTLSGSDVMNIKDGDWIVIFHDKSQAVWHFQATGYSHKSRRFSLVKPLYLTERNGGLDKLNKKRHDIQFCIYDQDFSKLTLLQKQASVISLLETLPSIAAIAKLLRKPSSDNLNLNLNPSLLGMTSPAALLLLRWIVQSNRSYIVHDTEKSYYDSTGRISLLKFRFLQGAPDKEHRFMEAVKKYAAGQKPQTIMAWHGSPIFNWHSISREGLHFRRTAHGRSWGNGVYLSQQFDCSLGFSTTRHPADTANWPGSCLDMKYVISLNEVVNCPQSFVYSGSGTYVVQYLDWIQTRYLYVGSGGAKSNRKVKHYLATQMNCCNYPPSLLHSVPNRVVIDLVDEENSAEERPAKKARKHQNNELDAIWNSFQG
ncbi:hypothetical protein PENSTE_c002G00254 [Penicillium steckii]|uniref:PARP catalytic domain-containing protein n=1 Tax=Penicillium steckii TaxID=303698 RepID=A0A1V6TW33_9EURO|nr:hypothetical protein PENSTE_c002G00254 [Penicillium steckii]